VAGQVDQEGAQVRLLVERIVGAGPAHLGVSRGSLEMAMIRR
jgi:hypothetical protein